MPWPAIQCFGRAKRGSGPLTAGKPKNNNYRINAGADATLDGLLLFKSPNSENTPALWINCRSYCLVGRRCEEFLENEAALVREPEYPTRELKKPRLLPDI